MILDQFRLDGQTALVTGCRRGIGMALAEALAEAGADIIGVSASLKERGEEVATRVTKLSRKFTGFQCDLSDRQSLHDLTRKITGTPIDILVNNAGTIRRAPAAEYSDEDWDNVIEVNLSAQFILTRESVGRCWRVDVENHLHRVVAYVSRRDHGAGVCSEQGRTWTTDDGPIERMGRQRS